MKHQNPAQFVRKGEEESPDDVVTKALADFTGKVEDRLKAVEKAADTTALTERLDKIEAKTNRAKGQPDDTGEPSEIRKAFARYLAKGESAGPDTLKALTTLQDPKAGYLAPPEMATEMIKDLVEVSPIRQFASVRQTSAPSVIYPRRTGITNAKWRGETEGQQASEPGFGNAEIKGCHKSLRHRRERGWAHGIRNGRQQNLCAAERHVGGSHADIDGPRSDHVDESVAKARRFCGILDDQHIGACASLPFPLGDTVDVLANAVCASVSSCISSGDASSSARSLRRRAVSALVGSAR